VTENERRGAGAPAALLSSQKTSRPGPSPPCLKKVYTVRGNLEVVVFGAVREWGFEREMKREKSVQSGCHCCMVGIRNWARVCEDQEQEVRGRRC